MPADPVAQPCEVCGVETTQRCSSCAKAGIDLFFCSTDHQKLVWPAHKAFCGSFPFAYPTTILQQHHPFVSVQDDAYFEYGMGTRASEHGSLTSSEILNFTSSTSIPTPSQGRERAFAARHRARTQSPDYLMQFDSGSINDGAQLTADVACTVLEHAPDVDPRALDTMRHKVIVFLALDAGIVTGHVSAQQLCGSLDRLAEYARSVGVISTVQAAADVFALFEPLVWSVTGFDMSIVADGGGAFGGLRWT